MGTDEIVWQRDVGTPKKFSLNVKVEIGGLTQIFGWEDDVHVKKVERRVVHGNSCLHLIFLLHMFQFMVQSRAMTETLLCSSNRASHVCLV